MLALLALAAVMISGCASTNNAGGAGGSTAAPFKQPSSMPSHYCTYNPSFSQPGMTSVTCF